MQVLIEGKITAVKMKMITLGLDSSSSREGKIYLEASVKTVVPDQGKHLCFKEEGQVD